MGISGLLLCIAIIADDDPATIVAHVNGTAITKGDVEFSATQQGISPSERPEAEPKLIERLIDRQLIRDVLATRKIEPVGDELELQIGKVELAIKNRGEDPKQFLKKLGYSQERLKNELGLALAWQAHIRKVITPAQSKNYFDQHRSEFDGTQVRARQIFLKLPKPANDSETSERRKRLALIRQNIVDQKLTFEEAAKEFSEAPSRATGGDIGLFTWQGKLPSAVSQAAFALKVNEISEPIISPFGVHLIQVTERHPGDFSIEDVRPIILDRLSQQIWKETVEKERATAKIERNLVKSPSANP